MSQTLSQADFTGRIEQTKQPQLSDARKALGRDLFFDKILGLRNDNTCSGCHAPQRGFGDTQSIAIGVENNDKVGPSRTGPRNQRRSPILVNTAFYPALMWNGRFNSPSGDPFDNSGGFVFPPPEGTVKFPPYDSTVKHLLAAQGHIPPTELPEMAGFTGIPDGELQVFSRFGGSVVAIESQSVTRPLDPAGVAQIKAANSLRAFRTMAAPGTHPATGGGDPVPPPDSSGFRNEPVRTAVLTRIHQSTEYRKRFAEAFPEVAAGQPINFDMIGIALADFQIGLTRADAPLDKFARGDRNAMTTSQKEGALIFFGKGQCVSCHAVGGRSNEMFSDFQMHNIGVPPLMPGKNGVFEKGKDGNVDFDLAVGDTGLEEITKSETDRYKFRTSPLRNVALQNTFMHNGAFTRLEDAIRHHLDVRTSLMNYDPRQAGVAGDLANMGPKIEVLARLTPRISPVSLTQKEFDDLVTFVRDGLQDPRATPQELCKEKPASVPSGRPLQTFEGC